jgi:16S rRNA (guanine966-N2)-methyltransferase
MAKSGRPLKSRSRARPEGRFRIIGGEWRGRRLPVPEAADVRPTPDRVRETLFNWLAPVIEGARCLDLYAGSGALGLEALSRGAARAVFVDLAPAALRQIDANLATLKSARGETVRMDAMRYIEGPATPFDVVFLDPPYRRGLVAPAMTRLVEGGWLAAGARVYLEHEAEAGPPQLPPGWELHRSAAAGRVRYHLARPDPRTAGNP